MKIRVHRTPASYDHEMIRFIDKDGKEKGQGFIGRKGDKNIGLERCPECGRENYAMNVLSGTCCWCGFNANKCDFE